jgi:hypothetical protein
MDNFNVCDIFDSPGYRVVDAGKPTNMLQEFTKVTLEAMSQVSFTINTHAIEDPNSQEQYGTICAGCRTTLIFHSTPPFWEYSSSSCFRMLSKESKWMQHDFSGNLPLIVPPLG